MKIRKLNESHASELIYQRALAAGYSENVAAQYADHVEKNPKSFDEYDDLIKDVKNRKDSSEKAKADKEAEEQKKADDAAKAKKQKEDEKKLDDLTNTEIHNGLAEVEKIFNTTSKPHWDEAKDKLIGLYKNKDAPRIAKILSGYKPEFLKNWLTSFGTQPAGDLTEPFMKALNNPRATRMLGAGDENNWVMMYNLLFDSNNKEYPDINDALVYNHNLYDKVKSNSDRKSLVRIDMNTDDDKIRQKFNANLDNNEWDAILQYGKNHGIERVEDDDELNDKAISQLSKLSGKDKVSTLVKLKPTQKELTAAADIIGKNNAANNKAK